MSNKFNAKYKLAVLWDLSGAFVNQFSTFIITILLARLLGPEEFGLIALAMVVINISNVLLEGGFSSALIQKKKVKDIAFSSVFYVNLGLSIILSLVIILSAPLFAKFFERPTIQPIIIYLSVIPPISALGAIQSTILIKKVDFKSLSIRTMIATAISGLIGVIAALLDYGVYSLVAQQIALVCISTIIFWFATGWRPKLAFSIKEIKKLLSFSSYVFYDALLRRIFLNINTLFIGKVFCHCFPSKLIIIK